MRGFGRSALPTEEAYSHVDDLKALLVYLGIAQAHIIGLSMGGSIAINFALTHPEMTSTLIAVDSGLDGYSSAEFQQTIDAIGARTAAAGGKAANEVWLDHPFFIPARENPVVGARLAQIVGENSGWHWVNNDPHRAMDPPALQRLYEITCPTLIIIGQRDESYMHDITAIMQQKVHQAHTVVLPGVGHMSSMEAPELFNAAVLSFLQNS